MTWLFVNMRRDSVLISDQYDICLLHPIIMHVIVILNISTLIHFFFKYHFVDIVTFLSVSRLNLTFDMLLF